MGSNFIPQAVPNVKLFFGGQPLKPQDYQKLEAMGINTIISLCRLRNAPPGFQVIMLDYSTKDH
jgi:hypothetical protein